MDVNKTYGIRWISFTVDVFFLSLLLLYFCMKLMQNIDFWYLEKILICFRSLPWSHDDSYSACYLLFAMKNPWQLTCLPSVLIRGAIVCSFPNELLPFIFCFIVSFLINGIFKDFGLFLETVQSF